MSNQPYGGGLPPVPPYPPPTPTGMPVPTPPGGPYAPPRADGPYTPYTPYPAGPTPPGMPPKPPASGVKGWKVGLLATGTGLLGLVVGIGIGGAGEDSTPATTPSPTADRAAEEPSAQDDETPEDVAAAPDESETGTADADADAASDEGTRNNPFTIGTLVMNDTWEVVLGEPREAWDEVQAENQFNDPPAEGMSYYIVPVTATYVGAETGLPWIDLTVEFVGSDARTYSDRCGVVPDDLTDVAELYEGGVGEGNVCLTVPDGADGLWTLSTGWFDDVVFFAAAG